MVPPQRRCEPAKAERVPPALLQPELRRKASRALSKLSPRDRESFLVKSWMSHDSKWFMAVAMNFGLEAAMHVNRAAIHDAGRVEARRLRSRLDLPQVRSVSDYLLFQETAISLLGPELLDYTVSLTGEDEFEIRVDRCFAFDNVSRAGIADQYECGIMPRLLGWLEGLGVDHKITPEPGPCLKARGAECRYAITVNVPEAGGAI